MYGMVNQMIKNMVCELFDEKTWKLISQNAGVQSEDFEIFKQFDDSISLNLDLSHKQ